MRSISAILILAAAFGCAAEPELPPGGEIFRNGSIRRIAITIPPEGIAELRTNTRAYVPAVIREGTGIFHRVGIHLKGSSGSFRKIDDKPGLTLSFDRFTPGERFHGLRKIHLNNSVEDRSYMHEWIGSEVFRGAGIPAPRVAHALVELNGRPLGLYILKEGFTEEFLALHFRHPTGNLYEPEAGGDVDDVFERQLGRIGEAGQEIAVLAGAAQEPDPGRRWQRLHQVLDVEQFITFMAMEMLTGHRDGYCLARNNYRIYYEVDRARLIFIPHGMDQLFGNPRMPVQPRMNGLVARAIMGIPQGRQQYRERCALLLTNVLVASRWAASIDRTVESVLAALPAGDRAALSREVAELKMRLAQRLQDALEQLRQAPLEMLPFHGGVATLPNWRPVDVPARGDLIRTETPGGPRMLTIQAGPITSASWRSKVILVPGKYRFEGKLRTRNVAPMPFGRNHGAALRVANAAGSSSQRLLGSQPWTASAITFETTRPEQEIDLICELRAAGGEASFDLDSLRLVRVK